MRRDGSVRGASMHVPREHLARVRAVAGSALAVLAVVSLAACGSEPRAVPDSGVRDVGAVDTGLAVDAADADAADVDVDAGLVDTGEAFDAGPGDPPVVIAFAASQQQVMAGDVVTLVWNTTGADTISIDASPGGALLVDAPITRGSTTTPPLTITTQYTLTAKNVFGMTQRAIVVGVEAGMPTIPSFIATPASVRAGETTTLSWQTTNANRVRILQGATTLYETTIDVGAGSWVTPPLPAGENPFTLEASNFTRQRTALIVVPAS
ncbi:hypothetical protein L6R52_20805 [Myxococcota bacterium]|nr:hypothetical protein [Myxococcota bacterium]